MARKVVQKTSFLGGESGPLLEGRSDLAQFQLGTSPGQNFINFKNGAVSRRPGTRYVTNTLNNKPAKLIPFVVSYDNGGDIHVLELALASSTSITLRSISADGSVGSVSGSPITVSAMTEDELQQIQFTQSAGRMFLTSKFFEPKVVSTQISGNVFIIENYIRVGIASLPGDWAAVPFLTTNISTTTLSIDVATVGTGRVVTSSTSLFAAAHVGSYWGMKTGASAWGYFKITAVNTAQEAVVTVVTAVGAAATATTVWAESAWNAHQGWPRTVTLYDQRLAMGGNTAQPDTFWLSQISDYQQMSVDKDAAFAISNPLVFTLNSTGLNQICWMVGGKKLSIGTSSSEWVGTVTNDGTSLFVQFNEETSHGSAPVQPTRFSYTIPFVQRSGQTIREMAFDFNSDAYQATDLNLFGSHVGAATGEFASIANIKIIQMAYQESPFGVLWCLDNQGRVFGLTRDKQQQVASWHSHTIGGVNPLRVDGKAIVKSICCAPNLYGTMDRLWMVVHRYINGVSKYFVEWVDEFKPSPYLKPFNGQADVTIDGTTFSDVNNIAAHLDCASVDFEATATTIFNNTAFTHLASQEVYVIAMNNTEADGSAGEIVFAGLLTVDSSGNITLPRAAETIVVGFHSPAYLRLLPIEGGDAPEINMNSEKGVDSVAIRMHETWGLRIGKNRVVRQTGNEENTTFEPIPFSSTDLPTISTFTGIKTVPVPCDEGTDVSFALAMQEPWPCTILSLSMRVTNNEV